MDNLLYILIILAIVAIVAFLLYRRRTRTEIKGPFGTGVTIEGSNEPAQAPRKPKASVSGVEAGRDVSAENKAGGDATVRDAKAGRDIKASTEDGDPKA